MRLYLGFILGLLIVPGALRAEPQTQSSIPSAFHGAWSQSLTTCASPHEDTYGFSVSAFEMAMYDGKAYVTSVTVKNAREILVAADWDGEGEKWQETDQLKLTKSGSVLTLNRIGKSGRGSSFTVVRCP